MRGIHSPLYWALYGAFSIILLGMAAIVQAAVSDEISSGALVAQSAEGGFVAMPLLSTDVKIDVNGPIARTSVKQQFKNDSNQWIEALYLFPLPENAAVDRLNLLIGDRVVAGRIEKKEKAEEIYQRAKEEGHKAALVEQDKPNLFHTSVANIPPRGEITVHFEYQQTLVWRDKSFGLRFPLAITPRFAPVAQEMFTSSALKDGWVVHPETRKNVVDLTGSYKPKTSINVSLSPGFEIDLLESASHPINVTSKDHQKVMLTVGQEKSALSPRDFVLRWAPTSSDMPRAAFFSEKHEKGYFGLVTITPPDMQKATRVNREVIFVIDTSGSMMGSSITAAKESLLVGIDDLQKGDAFNIVEFNSAATALFSQAIEVDLESKAAAYRFVKGLQASGGTDMEAALDLALNFQSQSYWSGVKKSLETRPDRLKQVVFITDGAVGYEKTLFEKIRKNIGNARLFTVGIGSAPNAYFMTEAAIAGRGTFTFVDETSQAKQKMEALIRKISRPVLTDIAIKGKGIATITPRLIPDLYYGEPLAFSVQMTEPNAELQITGRFDQTAWKEMLEVQATGKDAGIALAWAKRSVDDWNRSYLRGVPKDFAVDQITKLGLDYQFVTPYTSLVAVDPEVSRPKDEGLTSKTLPSQKPEGLEIKYSSKVDVKAIFNGTSLAMAQTATGYELTLMAGLMLFLLSAFGLRFAKRSKEVVA